MTHPHNDPPADLASFLSSTPVIPVLTVHRAADAEPLARALVAGGLNVLEVTLRTPAALDAIARMAEVDGALVGAGTLTRPADVDAVLGAGGRFGVSPGLTPDLGRAAKGSGLPLLPGVMTPSEAMAARDAGFPLLKLFPAEAAGGRPLLRSLAGPLADLRFCPTGGISADTFLDYLALPNVLCVGGSWIAPKDAVADGDWGRVEALARAAVRAAAEAGSTPSPRPHSAH
ncbi:MAG: bifunctional 4-hydroxy-2-oxoglutarate aldolase/2-dehydro-3-deoxy-phosphogluconate aldolase [Acidobacteriota bacterium]